MIFRKFTREDYPEVKNIYQMGMDTKDASFELVAPDWEFWDKKFHQNFRLVAEIDTKIVGWVALMPVSPRAVYSGVCELSIYIHSLHFKKGIAKKLMIEIINLSEQNNIWLLQSGIFRENTVSLELHKKLGFREVGFRERIGKMEGAWRDVILLERRSKIAGCD